MIRILAILGLFGLCYGHVLPMRKMPGKMGSNDIGTPCSTNASGVWVNVFLMVDVSTNMGASQLRQLSLSLGSELSKFPIAKNSCSPHTSQFAVISYSDTANVVANIEDIKSSNDLTNALLSLKLSTSSSSAGIMPALQLADKLWTDFDNCCYCNITDRVGVFVFVGASSKNININGFFNDLYQIVMPWDSVITINANPNDAQLTTLFNNISSPSMNLSMSDKNVYSDLTWALTQSNCGCNIFGELDQLVLFNSTSNKWTRMRDCYQLTGFGGFNDQGDSVCKEMGFSDAAITSYQKQSFIANMIDSWDQNYFVGLHRTAQKSWAWFDYDGKTEIPLGSYAPWAQGYSANSPGDCVTLDYDPTDSNFTTNYLWAPISCHNMTKCDDSTASDCVNVICQTLACDADNNCSGFVPNITKTEVGDLMTQRAKAKALRGINLKKEEEKRRKKLMKRRQ